MSKDPLFFNVFLVFSTFLTVWFARVAVERLFRLFFSDSETALFSLSRFDRQQLRLISVAGDSTEEAGLLIRVDEASERAGVRLRVEPVAAASSKKGMH